MNKNNINQWHINQDVSRENHCLKPLYLYAYIINMSEDRKLVLTRTIPHKYDQLSQLTRKLLAKT